MFRDSDFISSVKVTAVFVLIGVPLQLLVALSVALLLNKGLSGIGFYRTIYYIPSLLGGSVAIALLWKNIFGTDGIVNDFLSLFGVQGRGWVSHPDYAIYTLILLSAWQFGSSMVIFLAGLKQIPPELYEAAAVDGANGFMKFKDITLPLLSPVILFNFGHGFNQVFAGFYVRLRRQRRNGWTCQLNVILHTVPLSKRVFLF